MNKSRIMANLEEILKPVPKKERQALRRKKSLDNYFKRRAQNYSAYEKEEDEWREADELSCFRGIGELLRLPENRKALREARNYFKANTKNIPEKEIDLSITLESLVTLFGEMKGIVDGMLGIECEKPLIQFIYNSPASWYFMNKKLALIGINRLLPNNCAHEYAHHVTSYSKAQAKWIKSRLMEEGFAHGIGRNASTIYASNHDMPLLAHMAFDDYTLRIARAESTLKNQPMFPDKQDITVYGIAAFLVAEAKHGKSIYREIIKSHEPAEYLLKKLK